MKAQELEKVIEEAKNWNECISLKSKKKLLNYALEKIKQEEMNFFLTKKQVEKDGYSEEKTRGIIDSFETILFFSELYHLVMMKRKPEHYEEEIEKFLSEIEYKK